MAKEKPVGGIPLTEVVGELRREISKAVRVADENDESLRFRLDKVQVELQVAVTREVAGKSGANIWVLEFGVEGTTSNSRTQKVVLDLTPVPEDERPTHATGVFFGRQADNP